MSGNIILHGLDERLDKILEDTYYQLIYQEQVTAIATQLAGWSEGEADGIRKTIGRKIQKELDLLIPRLIKDFISHGMKEASAKQLASAIQACGSYSFNKCLAGSEVVMRLNNCVPLTLEEMYKICNNKDYAKKTGHRSLRFKYRRHNYGTGYSMDEENTVIDNRIFNIEFGGIREVFKVTLSNGETVRCTSNHKFPTNKGVLQLSEIQVGDSLYVIKKEKQLNYSYMVGEGTNLPQKGQLGFQKKEFAISRIFENYRDECKNLKKICELCGRSYDGSRFELHHKDLNRNNSNLTNLQWLCCSCHKKEHYRIGRRSIGYARRYFEECKIISIVPDGVENTYSVEMLGEPHNFVLANGIVSCNSHSVEYGLIAYQTAYLKANYPVQYMCSLLNANIDTTDDVIPYINECKRMGIKILPPDVSRGNLFFVPENGAIRVGLSYIKGISNITVDYSDKGNLINFFARNKYNKRIKEALIKAGALDCFNCSRAEQFAIAMNIKDEINSEKTKIRVANTKIREKEEELAKSKEGTKKVGNLKNQIENQHKAIAKSEKRIKELQDSIKADYDEAQGEIDVLGFTFHDKYEKYDTEKYQVYNKELTIQQKIICDIISVRKTKDKRGRNMAFISAIPYMGVKQDFVMFANHYQEVKEGIYAMLVAGNQVIGVGVAQKK